LPVFLVAVWLPVLAWAPRATAKLARQISRVCMDVIVLTLACGFAMVCVVLLLVGSANLSGCSYMWCWVSPACVTTSVVHGHGAGSISLV